MTRADLNRFLTGGQGEGRGEHLKRGGIVKWENCVVE